ncbi:MAG: hypothetical protein SPI94_06865 [Candidatus Onthovivens sp.]|nr:hypothetical protein [Candidatus Onthovivens sp.]
MNFYQLIKQQYKYYKIEEVTLYTRCDKCPCKTLRDKIFYNYRQREMCHIEMVDLIHRYHITENYITWLCEDCRMASLIIAKKLFEKEGFNKI